MQELDTSVLLFIQEQLRAGFLTPVLLFFSAIGSAGLIWIAAGALMTASRKTRYGGIVLLLSLLITWVLNDCLLKPLIHRPRPFETLQELVVLVNALPHGFSFPSGHTATSFAAAYAAARTLGRRWAWLYAVAALIAFSRLYLGVHYPADVLGGAVCGTLTAAVVCIVSAKHIKPLLPAVQPPQKRG